MDCGSGMSCRRRLRDWQQAGVWQQLHDAMLYRLQEYDQIEWARSDRFGQHAFPLGGSHAGPNSTDRGKLGCKHHVIVDQSGLPLAV